ncbi:benzoate/H(+) symporter BenE family transporter [Neotabrizicola sp. sgz301269]|uniref:benzoate/H(+) symporter BenE family transporter n=1 Tax=Neotabrizicola sp. sgz301269 TaxID=3276282 RepID=UPI00376FE9B4
MRISVISAAFVAALVGYGSTIALVLAAAAAVGASAEQTASWVLAVCLAKAVGAAVLSTWHRVPVVLAWSTPGTALIAATEGLSIHQAVGAFVLTGLLIALTGLIRPLGRAVAMIPDGISGGMLAGVLLPFVLKGAGAAQAAPVLVLPMLAVFALVRLKNPAVAVIAALAAGLGLAFATGTEWPALTLPFPKLVLIWPEFQMGTVIGLVLPLYLVTMASQNLPGFATMRAAGYEPPVRSALGVTGLVSSIFAFFGAHTVSMAAITAAICMGPDVHPVKEERWKVGLAYAFFWLMLGLFSPVILTLIAALPPQVMLALVALALLGALTGALATAMAIPEQRFAAVLTLGVTAAGVPFLGIGAAFWGLVAGVGLYLMERTAARR